MLKPSPQMNALRKLPRRLRRALAKTDDTLPLLADKKYDSYLYDKYKYFNDPGLLPVRDSVISAWAHINQMVNSQEFIQGTGIFAASQYARGTADSKSAVYKHVLGDMANINYYMAVYEKSVEIRLTLPDIHFSMGFGYGLGRDINARQDESRQKAQKILQTFLPDFKLPTMWKRNDGTKINGGVPFAEANVDPMKSTKRMPLEFLKKLNVPFTPQTDWTGPKEFLFAPQYEGNFDGSVTLDFEIEEGGTRVRGSAVSLARGAGPLSNMGAAVEYTMKVHAYLRFPLEYALWSTSCVKKEQFVPKLFHEFTQRQLAYALRTTGGRRPPERVSNLAVVRDSNKMRQQRQKFIPRPRTNKEDYCILENGRVTWIPTVDNVSDYMQSMRNSYDAANNSVKPSIEINKTIARGLKNRAIYTDWLNNRFSYTNEAGELHIISLEGAVPLDNTTIHRLLSMGIVQQAEYMIFHPQHFFSILNTVVSSTPTLLPQDIREKGYQFTSVENMVNFLANSGLDVTFYNIAGEPLDRGMERYQTVVDALRSVVHNVREKLGDITNQQTNDRAPIKVSFTQLAQHLRLGLDLILVYGKDAEKYKKAFRFGVQSNNTEQYSLDDVDAAGEAGAFNLPNLPGLTRFAPHQAQTVGALAQTPRFVILNIPPGGGKTPIALADIMMLKAAGKIGRPICFMPKALVKQYCDEINKFSQGKINAFPLTLETLRRLREVLGFSTDEIVDYLRGLPPNTIFVSDYNLLRNRSDLDTGRPVKDMVYGTEEIVPYPMVDLLRRVEFQYILADESQSIKNKDAQRTKALNALAVDIPYRRIASGTIVSNTPTDIVGQVGMLNPSIFMNANKFALDYGKTFENGSRRRTSKAPKVLSWNGEIMGPSIKKEIRPYAQYHSKSRQDWAFLLPDVEENFFQAVPNLTAKQREYYDELMSEAYEKIQSDIDLMKKMKEGAPEDEDAIEAKLSRYFAKVEIFVNAPYEDAHYRQKIDPDDIKNQVSPKVAITDAIIDAHFNGGEIQGVNFVPDNNKIIIFGYNVAVSKHIFKYSRHRNIMIHYEAGNDEALAKFQDPDSRYKILVANEDSIKEGFNLQIASHIIREQTIWSPGPLEQAWSRVLRPDFARKYNRQEIRLSWILTPNTIEIPKTARLISKIIDKAKIDYDRKLPDYVRDADLEVLKMSLDTIKDYKTFEDIATAKGSNYLQTYAYYKNWQRSQLNQSIQLMIDREKRKAAKAGRDTNITRDDLQDLVMIPVTSTQELPGSKQVYVPRVAGSQNFVTTTGIEVVPASMIEEDEEGQIINERVIRPLEPGMLVDTEFGPGHVVKVLDSAAWVQVKAFPRPIKLPKSIIGVPANQKAEKRLRKKVANDLGNSLIPKNLPIRTEGSKVGTTQEDVDFDTEDTDELPTEFEDHPGSIKIRAAIINGIPTLWTATTDKDIAVLTKKMNWHVVPPFMAAKVVRYNGIATFIKYVEKSGLVLSAGNKTLLTSLADVMRENNAKLLHVKKDNLGKKWRDFFSSAHRRPTEKNQVRIYPFIWEGQVFLALTPSVHHPKVISKLKSMTAGNGMHRFRTFEYDTIMFPYGDMRRAMKEIREIERDVKIENRDQLLEDLKSIHLA